MREMLLDVSQWMQSLPTGMKVMLYPLGYVLAFLLLIAAIAAISWLLCAPIAFYRCWEDRTLRMFSYHIGEPFRKVFKWLFYLNVFIGLANIAGIIIDNSTTIFASLGSIIGIVGGIIGIVTGLMTLKNRK